MNKEQKTKENNIKQLVKSFCLKGKITEKHARDIEKLIKEFLEEDLLK